MSLNFFNGKSLNSSLKMESDSEDDYCTTDDSSSPPRTTVDREQERKRSNKGREENGLNHNEIPYKYGRWPVLLHSEETELVRTILEWPDDDIPPSTAHVPLLVSFCSFFFKFCWFFFKACNIRLKRECLMSADCWIPTLRWAQIFVHSHKEVKAITPMEVSKQRKEACYLENLEPFLTTLDEMFEMNKYEKSLIFHLDETSLQVKYKNVRRRIVPASRSTLFILALPPIYHTTTLFIVSADGYHENTHLVLPFEVEIDQLPPHPLKFMHAHQSAKGWMMKTMFEEICETCLIPAILKAREALPEGESTRALLLLDGASTHSSRSLMEKFAKISCDVVCIPAHTSHLIQPLDRCPNSRFKAALKEQQLMFPKKKEMKTELLPFLRGVEAAAEKALWSGNIIAGFQSACMALRPCRDILPRLEKKPATYDPKPSKRFSISGKVMTDPNFLKMWEEHEKAKENKTSTLKKSTEVQTEKAALKRKRKRRKKARLSEYEGIEGESEYEKWPASEPCSCLEKNSEENEENKEETEKKTRKAHERECKKRKRKSSPSPTTEDTTEYDEDGPEIIDIDLNPEEDVFPLTPKEVQKVKESILKCQSLEIGKRVRKVGKYFDEVEAEQEKMRKRVKYS
jgi:hypothetical protein